MSNYEYYTFKKMYLYIFDIFKCIYIQLMKDLVLNLQTFLFLSLTFPIIYSLSITSSPYYNIILLACFITKRNETTLPIIIFSVILYCILLILNLLDYTLK